jgi:hypothetical protein
MVFQNLEKVNDIAVGVVEYSLESGSLESSL